MTLKASSLVIPMMLPFENSSEITFRTSLSTTKRKQNRHILYQTYKKIGFLALLSQLLCFP